MARRKVIAFLTATLTALIGFLALSAVVVPSLQAQTPDGETPAEEGVCDALTGNAFGVCTAYCEAQDCSFEEGRSCEVLRTNFERATGSPLLPCDDCETCLDFAAAGLDVDCDLFDDGEANGSCTAPPDGLDCPGLIITEILYNPSAAQGSDSANEWVEIRNESCGLVDLTDWTIEDRVTQDLISPLDGGPASLEPGEYALVIDGVGSDVLTNAAWEIAPGTRIFGTADSTIGSGLNNTGDTLTIRDSIGDIVEQVEYDDTDSSGCGNEANGDGFSLEREDPVGPGDCTNFRSSELQSAGFPIGGTPGGDNHLWFGSVCNCVEAECASGVNPHGKPSRGGFFELLGRSPLSPGVEIFVSDSDESGPFGPFMPGDNVKITVAPGGEPGSTSFGSSTGQAGEVVTDIKLTSDAVVIAFDAAADFAGSSCDNGGPVPLLDSRCISLSKFAKLAIDTYLQLIKAFREGEADCDDLDDAFENLNNNVDRCRLVCGNLPCPSKPQGPGDFPGTEACGDVVP